MDKLVFVIGTSIDRRAGAGPSNRCTTDGWIVASMPSPAGIDRGAIDVPLTPDNEAGLFPAVSEQWLKAGRMTHKIVMSEKQFFMRTPPFLDQFRIQLSTLFPSGNEFERSVDFPLRA